MQDLNLQPTDYKSVALAICANSAYWCAGWDSNPQNPVSKTDTYTHSVTHTYFKLFGIPSWTRTKTNGFGDHRANPLTLRIYECLVRPAGLEPATLRLKGECSNQLSYGRILRHLSKTRTSNFCDITNADVLTT